MDWGAETLTVSNGSSMLLSQSENDTGLISNDSISADVITDPQRFPLYLRITATSICVLLLMIGCTGNILVPLVVLKTKDLRNSTNIFLINLSIADLLILLISSPTVLIELHTQPETWYLGLFMCKFFFLFSLLKSFFLLKSSFLLLAPLFSLLTSRYLSDGMLPSFVKIIPTSHPHKIHHIQHKRVTLVSSIFSPLFYLAFVCFSPLKTCFCNIHTTWKACLLPWIPDWRDKAMKCLFFSIFRFFTNVSQMLEDSICLLLWLIVLSQLFPDFCWFHSSIFLYVHSFLCLLAWKCTLSLIDSLILLKLRGARVWRKKSFWVDFILNSYDANHIIFSYKTRIILWVRHCE